MKKMVLLLIAGLISTCLFAQPKSDLTIGTTGSSNLKIRLDGRRIILKDRSMTLENLVAGFHSLVIYQLQRRQNGSYEYATVFNNNIKLVVGKHLELTVLRFGKIAFDEGFSGNDDWNDWNYSDTIVGGGYNGHQQAANDQQFKDIKAAISKQFSDDDKLGAAKTILRGNWLSVKQVKELASLFFSDSNKLQFLKDAYNNCTEKGSYFTLADTLFSSFSKSDFMKWFGER